MIRRLLSSAALLRQDTGSGSGGVAVAAKTFMRQEACTIIAAHYRERHAEARFKAIRNVEHMDLHVMRAHTTAGTNLEPAVAALKAAGVNVGSTIGEFMDAASLNRDQIHEIACDCHQHGIDPSGNRMADLFEAAGKA